MGSQYTLSGDEKYKKEQKKRRKVKGGTRDTSPKRASTNGKGKMKRYILRGQSENRSREEFVLRTHKFVDTGAQSVTGRGN